MKNSHFRRKSDVEIEIFQKAKFFGISHGTAEYGHKQSGFPNQDNAKKYAAEAGKGKRHEDKQVKFENYLPATSEVLHLLKDGMKVDELRRFRPNGDKKTQKNYDPIRHLLKIVDSFIKYELEFRLNYTA